mgnify:CR=1 FL=1
MQNVIPLANPLNKKSRKLAKEKGKKKKKDKIFSKKEKKNKILFKIKR